MGYARRAVTSVADPESSEFGNCTVPVRMPPLLVLQRIDVSAVKSKARWICVPCRGAAAGAGAWIVSDLAAALLRLETRVR
jgi:hypothetical protein